MTTPAETAIQAQVAELIEAIAKEHFLVDTLETRNQDRLDFHSVAVWSIKAALEEAYEAGLTAGRRE